MEINDWFLFILTFATGVFLGMFIFITSFKPTYAPEGLTGQEDTAAEFSVIGKSYGGFRDAGYIHPSFRVLGDGTYAYLTGGEGENALNPIEGTLPRGLLSRIRSAADEVTLQNAAIRASKDNCRMFADGTEYTYRVVLEGIEYQLDTCKTALDYSDPLALVLDDVWEFIGDPSRGYSGGSAGTPADRATDWLRERLSPYE